MLVGLVACSVSTTDEEAKESNESTLSQAERMPRYARIRDAAAAKGLRDKAFLLAGIANHESGMAMCWSEAQQHCRGPSSPDCGGGPVLAGSGDGACGNQQGGLGMFQFDAGTYGQTLNTYGPSIVTADGQARAAVDFVVRIVKISAYTTDAETDAKSLAWLNRFDVNNRALRDQWIKTVLRYYNGCPEGGSCWAPRYAMYNDALSRVLAETGGEAWWRSGTSCPGFPGVTGGAIDDKYLAMGGCGSVLGAPLTEERGTPDRRGRYNVFERGSIYWTEQTGAHEVHGVIRDAWKVHGWEAGILGYPITDEYTTPDKKGRYNVFEKGSIYWTEKTGAHEVHGRIRDAYKDAGWEAGALGYPIADEVDVPGGKKSDFEHGSITWDTATDKTTVTMKEATK